MPISYQGQRIGVLNVESPRKKAFDDNDKQVLEYWSEQLAISFGHFLLLNERVTSALNLAKQTIESGEAVPSQTKLSAWFGSVAQVALENLRATSMALVRLAPGTSHPVLPILVWPAVHRNIKPRITHIPENSGLWQLLNDWELRFWRADAPGASPSNMLDSARDEWVLDALRALHCQSLVFVPVGTRDNRVGALFVAYATAEPLGDLTQLSLLTFASALEKTYISLMTARTRSSYSMIGHAVHQTLVPATHNLLADADSIRRVSNDPKRVNEEITHLEQSVRDMSRFFKARTLNGRDALKNRLLEEALFIAAGELKTGLREPPQIGFDGIELLEDEAIETRRVIYRVVVEAISNSIVHGKARHIEVQADRLDFEITVEVCDDGVGMPNNPTRNQPFGIFHLRRLARQVWDARLTLERLHPHGTRVFLRLPVLPRKQNDDD
ncbi:MAG: hypothetical protein HC853_07960 [Anaerolineae bacterium]|nr:hypothetical protein [Anaerolineae bacterium]